MRLDKFLKVSRLIKRRTVANEVAAAGRVMVNDKPVKPSFVVKPGDIIEVAFAGRPVRAKVLSLVEPKGKDVAREMYEIIED
ncbi:RNA-binding S4 domain-containing protein [Ruminococcaceae bacterium OttesenSCG-928-D13]|nr:RNA-binding S4 domain-containing protein [Ruminococcaceae bacterium OttesenSCG-928-D13]